MLIIQKFTIF